MEDNLKNLQPYSGVDPTKGVVDAQSLSSMGSTFARSTSPSLLTTDVSSPFDKTGEAVKPLVSVAPSYSKRNMIAFNTKAQNLERYTSHPAYSRLGFSTLRDNESFYNANTKWTGDFVRASKYFFPVMGEVFLDNIGGGIRMFGNDGSLDPSNIAFDKGNLMTHSAKMAMSTRGGLGQSVVNIGYNMNYTLGIIAAIAAEDLLLAAVAPETFGGSLSVAGARTVQGLGKAFKGTWNTLKSVDKLKDSLSAKRVYDQVAGTGNVIAQSFTPSTYNFLKSSYRNSKAGTRGFSRTTDAIAELAGTAKGFGALYRDLRIAGLANDESMVEAAGVREATRERLITSYVAANGMMPSAKEIADMEKQAVEAGNVDYWANLPFIYLTNNITFNSLAMPYNKGSRLMKVRSGKAGSVWAKTTGEKGTGVIAENLTRRQAFVKMFSDKDMRRYAISSLGSYFAANISEGVQEIYQESASKAIEDYFSYTYLRPEMAGMKLAKKNIREGLAAQMSQQGLEAFLGGFLGGGIISGGSNIIAAGTDAIEAGYRKVNKSAQEAFEERLEKDKKINTALIDIINAEGSNVIEALAPELVALRQQADNQKGMSIALELNDRVLFESIKDESLLNYISALAQKGVVDNFLEALENHKQLSDEELLQAIPAESREQAEATLDAIASRTKSIVATQAYVDRNFNNYYLDALTDPTITGDERKQLQVAASAYEHAKQALVYMYYSNSRSLERLKEITEAAAENPVVAGLMANDITPLFNIDGGLAGYSITLETETAALGDEVKTLKQQIANLKSAVTETEEDKTQNKAAIARAEKELSFKTDLKSKLEKYGKALKEFKTNLDAAGARGEITKVKGFKAFRYALGAVLETHAQQKGQSIDGIQLEKLVQQIVDFTRVKDMNKVFNQAVTNLSDPENFMSFYENVKTALERTFFVNLAEQLGKVQTASVEKRKDVLEALADIYVAIPNESINDINIPESDTSLFKFIEEGVLPAYYLGDPENQDVDLRGRVIEGTETWDKIQDILMRYDMLEQEAKDDLDTKIKPEENVDETTEEKSKELQRQEELAPYLLTVEEANKLPEGLFRDFILDTLIKINQLREIGGQELLDFLKANRSTIYDENATDNRRKIRKVTDIVGEVVSTGLAPGYEMSIEAEKSALDLKPLVRAYNNYLLNIETINAKYDVATEEVTEEVTYEEAAIRDEFKGQPEVLESLLNKLNAEYTEYRKANPRERISTLSEYMNGPGRAVTAAELESARAAAEGYRTVETEVVDVEEATKEFNSLKNKISRSKKISTLEARRLDVDSSSLMTDEQKEVLRNMINEKIAEAEAKEGPKPPTVSSEVNNDISDSSLGYTEDQLRNQVDSEDETNPFDSIDNVCE